MAITNSGIGRSAKRRSMFWGYILLSVTAALVYLLDHPIGALPALGRLIDPINGCWANAESVNKNFSNGFKLPQLNNSVTVLYDEQMVPHISAANDHDLYFLQGYIHAYFRLWQMDMQTRAAAGRVSEIIGEQGLAFDRKQRRKGMEYAAENSLRTMEADPRSKGMLDAYTEGVNCYISGLAFRNYPLEYKLMSFSPGQWTNLKSALLLKYMADDLTGKTDDIAHSYLRTILSMEEFELLYGDKIEGSATVIPGGTIYEQPSLRRPAAPADSIAFPRHTETDFEEPRESGKGSNNWALSGARTASGNAILCNDPHLALNLPSLWFQAQLTAPGVNVYGVTLPGTPGVVIGFNDSISWGITNNYRDVKDYYEIKRVAGDNSKYWFDGTQVAFSNRIEKIAIKDKPDFIDTVPYTIHGPVIYDKGYYELSRMQKTLAMCWMGHRPSNEQLSIYLINRAGNYNDFVNGIQHFECPAQNMLYADRTGSIALWGQGQFVNKWENQGRFIMNGSDSATLWGELIPMRENPHVLNPAQGFLASANQCVTDSTYPYWYNGDYVELRAWRINQLLNGMQKATIEDMFKMQNDCYSVLAANALPVMLEYLQPRPPDKYSEALKNWDCQLNGESISATVFQLWWGFLYAEIWKGRLRKVPYGTYPLPERTMQLFVERKLPMYCNHCDSSDYNNYCSTMVANSYRMMLDSMTKLETRGKTQWYKAKNTSIMHLTKIPAFSYREIATGGWGNTINAMRPNNGPSWRMVVQMGKEIEAYGIYPGGQSGNPGSRYYADYLQSWTEGKYHKLIFLPDTKKQSMEHIKYTWTLTPGK